MDESEKNPTVPILEAAALSGLSTHMITYLGRYDILQPSGTSSPRRGRARRYTFCDIIFLKVIAILLDKGIEIKRLRKSLQIAKDEVSKWIDIRSAPAKLLITDGTELFVVSQSDNKAANLSGQLVLSFVFNLHNTHEDISRRWPDSLDGQPLKRTNRQ